MRGYFILGIVATLMLTALPGAQAQRDDRPAAGNTVKAKKKKPPVATHAPRSQPARNAGEMTPGTGPALLRGVKDDNM